MGCREWVREVLVTVSSSPPSKRGAVDDPKKLPGAVA